MTLEYQANKTDEDDGEDDEKTEDEDENEDDETRSVVSKFNSFVLTFRDIEDSIKSFDGSPEYPIIKWIVDFEKR